jgi:hypothetical protein
VIVIVFFRLRLDDFGDDFDCVWLMGMMLILISDDDDGELVITIRSRWGWPRPNKLRLPGPQQFLGTPTRGKAQSP